MMTVIKMSLQQVMELSGSVTAAAQAVMKNAQSCMLQTRPETRRRNLFLFSFMTKLSQKLYDTPSETTARSP
jgi:hypothetical protein